jgi:predicted RNA binding protein with dsRBD fold (UPF0201 family)
VVKDKIVAALVEKGGYKQISGPLRIVDTDFGSDFDAVLVGPGQQGCLVLVVDGEHIPAPVIQRRVRSFSLVLDRSGSRRPLTVVVIARSGLAFEALERLCRVVVLRPDDDVLAALRGLLPLDIQSHEHTLNAAENALVRQLQGNPRSTLIVSLRKAATEGAANVESEVLGAIAAAIENSNPEKGLPK